MFFKNFNGGCKSNCSCEEVKCFKKVCQWVPFTPNLGCSQTSCGCNQCNQCTECNDCNDYNNY